MKYLIVLNLFAVGVTARADVCDWHADLYRASIRLAADMKIAEDVGPGCSAGSRQICADLKARITQDKQDILTLTETHQLTTSLFETWSSLLDRILGTGQFYAHGIVSVKDTANCP